MFFEKIANNSNNDSWSARLRRKRFDLFLSLLSEVERPINILDVGGTERFWQVMGFGEKEDISIALLNVDVIPVSSPAVTSIKGDARDIKFPDASFDIVFSNSVIEHVGGLDDQQRMAEEIQRVGKRCFIQTPNKNFFLEPHFLFPYFQFLPMGLRTWLLMNFRLGWFPKEPSPERALELVESIRLLTRKEFLALFPNAQLYEEKVLGMTKSFIVYAGWD